MVKGRKKNAHRNRRSPTPSPPLPRETEPKRIYNRLTNAPPASQCRRAATLPRFQMYPPPPGILASDDRELFSPRIFHASKSHLWITPSRIRATPGFLGGLHFARFVGSLESRREERRMPPDRMDTRCLLLSSALPRSVSGKGTAARARRFPSISRRSDPSALLRRTNFPSTTTMTMTTVRSTNSKLISGTRPFPPSPGDLSP